MESSISLPISENHRARGKTYENKNKKLRYITNLTERCNSRKSPYKSQSSFVLARQETTELDDASSYSKIIHVRLLALFFIHIACFFMLLLNHKKLLLFANLILFCYFILGLMLLCKCCNFFK
jgi:hypothetical protein